MKTIVLLLLTIYSAIIECSSGDIDPSFRKCQNNCFVERICDIKKSTNIFSQLINWSCEEQCDYVCMTEITQVRMLNNYQVLKYFGHWPFERYWGLEEPASVFFSFLNLIPHFVYLVQSFIKSSKMNINPRQHYMLSWLQIYALSACNAWIASTLFHCHKTRYATLYDYMSALAFLVCGLGVCVRRLLGQDASKVFVGAITAVLASLCGHRLRAMWLGLVTFDSHMQTCITLVVVTTVLWTLWVLLSGDSSSKSRCLRGLCLLCQAWLVLASALEVFDFPPFWRTFDAHSLWHAATVPLGVVWYWGFWKRDFELHLPQKTGPND